MMHGLKTPTLFGLRTSSRPASPSPSSSTVPLVRTSPPHVTPVVPTGTITPLDLSTPGSPIEGPNTKDPIPRRPLAKLHLPSAFRRTSSPVPAPSATPTPATNTGSNYLDALALRISEAAGKAIAPPLPAHNNDGLFLHGRRPLPAGRGKLLGLVIQSEIQNAHQGGQDLLRASLRALHRPLNVLLTNVSTLLAPIVVAAPTNVLAGHGWLNLGASQAHALGLATVVAELLECLDALPGDCAKVGGEGLRSIKQGLEGVISRVVQPVLTALRTELSVLIDQLEQGPLGGSKKENSLAGPIGVACKVLARVASVPGPVVGGAIAACEIAVVWRAMVALAHRKPCSVPKALSNKSSGPLKSSSPTRPTPLSKSNLPRRLTPPNTPPPTRFLLPTSRPPSPPTPASPAMVLANDARVVLAMLDAMPRPGGEDAREAVGEAVGAFGRFVEALNVLAQPAFDKAQLVRLVDGEVPVPLTNGVNKAATSSSDEDDELPALLVLPALLNGRSVASILGIDEVAYRERCLSGFGRAEASEGVVVRAVLARLGESRSGSPDGDDEKGEKVDVPEWVKEWMMARAED